MKRLYLYVYRCRRPSGWGTHNGYTGLTNRPDLRDKQHRSKDWYDLVRYRIVIPIGRMPRFVGLALEWALIRLTLPVYNIQCNRWNPRRIKPWVAREQRLARDRGRSPLAARAKDLVTLAPILGMVALAAWMVMRCVPRSCTRTGSRRT